MSKGLRRPHPGVVAELPSIVLLPTIGFRRAAQGRGWSSLNDPVRLLQTLDDGARHQLDLLIGCRPGPRANLEVQAVADVEQHGVGDFLWPARHVGLASSRDFAPAVQLRTGPSSWRNLSSREAERGHPR